MSQKKQLSCIKYLAIFFEHRSVAIFFRIKKIYIFALWMIFLLIVYTEQFIMSVYLSTMLTFCYYLLDGFHFLLMLSSLFICINHFDFLNICHGSKFSLFGVYVCLFICLCVRFCVNVKLLVLWKFVM